MSARSNTRCFITSMENIDHKKEIKRLQGIIDSLKKDKTNNWKDFRASGLLTYINIILQVFGWCIKVEFSDEGDEVINSYPEKTDSVGFGEDYLDRCYTRMRGGKLCQK